MENARFLETYRGLPKNIYILSLSKFICAVGCFVTPFISLILTRKVGIPVTEVALFCSIQGVMSALSSVIGGKIGDKFGKSRLVKICYAVSVLNYFLCGFIKPSYTTILIIFSNSCLNAIASPCIDALVADYANAEERKRAYSLNYLAMNMGIIIGPSLAGIIFNNYFSWLFWGDALTTLLALILICVYIQDKAYAEKDMGNLNSSEEIVQENVFTVLLKRPSLIFLIFLHIGFCIINIGWYFGMPLYLTNIFNNSGAKIFGLITSISGLTVMCFTPISTYILRKMYQLKIVMIGGVLYAIGYVIASLTDVILFFMAASFIFTLGEILTSVNIPVITANLSPASHRARISSMLSMGYYLAIVIAPLLIGNLFNNFSPSIIWRGVGICVFILAFITYFAGFNIKKNDFCKEV